MHATPTNGGRHVPPERRQVVSAHLPPVVAHVQGTHDCGPSDNCSQGGRLARQLLSIAAARGRPTAAVLTRSQKTRNTIRTAAKRGRRCVNANFGSPITALFRYLYCGDTYTCHQERVHSTQKERLKSKIPGPGPPRIAALGPCRTPSSQHLARLSSPTIVRLVAAKNVSASRAQACEAFFLAALVALRYLAASSSCMATLLAFCEASQP